MIVISVITPSFNSGATLQDTLSSVYRLSESIASHGLQLELIVVDGGSSDSTLDIANRYRNSFSNFSILQNVGGGPYRAMNEGLKCAKGEYSFILNSDDFIAYPKEYAEFIVSALAINSIILLSPITYFRRPSLVARHMWKIEPINRNRTIWKNKILSGLHYPHPGFIAKTDVYLSTMFDETYSLSADYKLMQIIMLQIADHQSISLSQIPYVSMAEGGLTSNFSAILKGYRQLRAINKELGIKVFPFKRYFVKFYRRISAL